MGIRREGLGSTPLIRLYYLIGKEETCLGSGVSCPKPEEAVGSRHCSVEQRGSALRRSCLF